MTVWTDRDDPYNRGEGARVYLNTDEPSYVTVFRVDTDGRLRVLFPREPWGNTYVRDGRDFEVSGARGGRSFIVDDYPGVGYLFAISSSSPFDYTDITRGDYWDYRLIDGGRLQGDPYVLLTDLAARITRDDDFDYDIVPYYVDRRYDYPRFVCYDCHAYASYAEWDPYARACSQVRVVIYDDPRYYPYRYNRGRNVVVSRSAASGATLRVPRCRSPQRLRDAASAPAGRRAGAHQRRRGRPGLDSGPRGLAGARPDAGRALAGGDPWPARGFRSLAAEQEGRRRETRMGGRRLAPTKRAPSPPQSTGEPELRRRRQ